jgi:predicted outer membrane repeat protein
MALYSVAECGAPSDVWVAAGLYKPDGGDPGNRALSFNIPPGSSVYGGFAGGESLLSEQDWQANVTVMSGDIDDDDISPDLNGVVTTHANIQNNNSYHVVTMDGTVGSTTVTASTVLDGFTITAGRANSSGNLATGGGLFCDGSGADNVCSPTLRHLVFSGNWANSSGGGLANIASPNGVSSPEVTDVTFVRNRAGNGGGGMFNFASFGGQSSPVLNNVTFDHNTASGGGGMSNGAYQGTSSPSLTDVVFDGNTSSGNGGGMTGDGASGTNSPSLTRVTFTGNSSTGNGGAMYGEAPGGTYSPILTDVTFQNNMASQDGGAMYNKGAFGSSNPTLVNVTFTGNSANGAGGAMYNNGSSGGESSPDIHNSTFYGNGVATVGDGTEDGGAIYNNADGGVSSPTLIHVTISGNEANVSGGGIYNSAQSFGNSSGFVINSIVWGNTALSGAQIQNALGTPYIGNSAIQDSFPSNVWDASLGTDGGGNTDEDPLLLPLADNGGLTQTMALAAGSSALDTADGDECLADDQRGVTRPKGVGCDIGAFEKVVFADVPVPGKEWMEPWIEAFHNAGITTGCGINPLRYCPENQVTRAEMAVFLLRAIHGAGYVPPAPAHDFADVPVTGKEWMEPWIEQFYAEGITTGCGGGNYCPENNVTRAEMAVFVLRALHGGGYSPPPATHTFADVPVPGKEWMEPWIDQFAAEGITTGCGGGNYCPENNVTRAEMAVFIDRAYGLYP